MNVISVKNLKKHFGETKAVDGISFAVKKGEIMGFLGPNGAGKTTTIRCLLDFLHRDAGQILIFNNDPHDYAPVIKKDIGYLSGEVNLYADWTGQEHLDLIAHIRGGTTKEKELIERFAFDPLKRVKNLSTGNKQKLTLILALMHNPKLLILDEPTAGLDPLLQDSVYEILKEKVNNGTTIFMSSHNLAEVERVCDRVIILKKGKIVATETIKELEKKRLYTVYVHFKKKVSKKKLAHNGIEITDTLQDGYVLHVKGDIHTLIKKLEQFEVKDLEISHARLEDVFLKFYKK